MIGALGSVLDKTVSSWSLMNQPCLSSMLSEHKIMQHGTFPCLLPSLKVREHELAKLNEKSTSGGKALNEPYSR